MDVISYALSKKYTDEKCKDMEDKRQQDNLKVTKVEKELNDYKKALAQVNINQEPRQSASGYGTISLPPNAANGQVSSVDIKGLTATNLINGKGDNLQGWTNISVLSVADGWIKHDCNNTVRQGTYPINLIAGHKIYTTLLYRVTGNGTIIASQSFRAYNNENYIGELLPQTMTNTPTNITRISQITTVENDANQFSFRPAGLKDIEKIGSFDFRDFMIIDLTQTFGAGNEPTKEECDVIFANYFDSTTSTNSAKRVKAVGKNLFNLDKARLGRMTTNELIPGGGTIYIEENNDIKLTTTVAIRGLVSNFIPIKANTPYVVSYIQVTINDSSNPYLLNGIKWYDNKFNYISATGDSYTTFAQGISPSNARYAIVQVANASKNTTVFRDIQFEEGTVPTSYEPYKESIAYVVAKKDNKIVILTTVKDTTGNIISQDRIITKENGEMECILENKSISNVATSTVINYADMKDGGYFNAYGADGEYQVGVKGDTLTFTATKLIYQLAEPEIIPIEASGNIVAHPNGTVYIEHGTFTAGVYGVNGIAVTNTGLPIKEIKKIIKIDYETGLEYELDTSKAIVSEDKLLFTHPNLTVGDIVFFDYDYDVESTEGLATVEFYDSRYVIEDKSIAGKYYTWKVEVDNGVPSITVVEV